mgnify:CR=1 FL=1
MKWKTNIINLNFQFITLAKITSRWLFTIIIFLFEAEHILILLPITIFTCVLKFWLTCFCVLNRRWKEYMYIYILHLQISAYSTIKCAFVFTFPCLPLVCEIYLMSFLPRFWHTLYVQRYITQIRIYYSISQIKINKSGSPLWCMTVCLFVFSTLINF